MDDDKRHVILRQVIDILLELWSHRFDTKGALFKNPTIVIGKGKDAWYIESSSMFTDPNDTGSRHRLSTTSYPHAADYWLAYANAKLLDISHSNFGSDTNHTSTPKHGSCALSSQHYSTRHGRRGMPAVT